MAKSTHQNSYAGLIYGLIAISLLSIYAHATTILSYLLEDYLGASHADIWAGFNRSYPHAAGFACKRGDVRPSYYN